jgi:hypothetical protein
MNVPLWILIPTLVLAFIGGLVVGFLGFVFSEIRGGN